MDTPTLKYQVFKRVCIGEEDARFDSSSPNFTQVLIIDDSEEVHAHFKGPMAKMFSSIFISQLP